jgi:ribosomal protein S24E
VTDIIHPGRANVSKAELQEKLGEVCSFIDKYQNKYKANC